MRRRYLYLLCLLCACMATVHAQDSIRHRVIFIGDAGEIDKAQKAVIPEAAAHILTGKTTVMYLGDNVYPKGMGLPGSPEENTTQQILRSQFQPMRSKGATVYFVPGNHDWDRMGPLGLQKIQQEWSFLNAQNDPLLQMVPANGCPDPVELNVSDSLTIIAFDSEWWLFPYNKTNPEAGCSCNSKTEVTEKIEELLYKNRYKMILLASHHPFQSYGHHGGYYSWKDHLFPLTSVNKNLYIPLPVIGSLYPLLRSTFVSPEDMPSPVYKSMIRQIDGAFDEFPNVVHVAGHEHGLQFIKKDNQVQVVSGAGAKEAYVKKGRNALFAETVPGFVVADLLVNNQLRFTYYTIADSVATASFSYTQPYVNIKAMEDSSYCSAIKADSVWVQANAGFNQVSKVHRWLFGENYRKEWAAKTFLPVIRLSDAKGGLTPIQRGGGHQSHSLRLKDKDGKEWVLRSVNKYPEILLPEQLRETVAKDIVTDAMSAQHPYSALVVPVIANAVKVPHANPVIGLVAPDKALGLYQRDFMNTVCLLEEREPAGKSDNTDKMYKELLKDNDNDFDSTLFLRARLLDLFIGDWDRHVDQWRWVPEKDKKGNKKYIAVPRDRDQVLHIDEGLIPDFITKPWILPLLHDFDGRIKQVNAFFTESNDLNKRFLNQFSYDEWMDITYRFVAALTDSVLEKALQQLPATSYTIRHDQLLKQWKERRSNMAAAMSKYYHFLSKTTDILLSNKNELVTLTDAYAGGLELNIHKINKDGKIKDRLYNRIFYPDLTKEIRLYLSKGDDSVVLNNHSSIKLRIIGGKGDKAYNVIQTDRVVQVYDRKKHITFSGDEAMVNKHLSNDSLNTTYIPANPYNKIIPALNVGYNEDDGVMLGGMVRFVNQGFRKMPYDNVQQVSFIHAFATQAYKLKYLGEWIQALGKTDLLLDGEAMVPSDAQNFFGLGNATTFNKTGDYRRYYRARFDLYEIDPALRWRSGKKLALSVGPSFQYYHFDPDDNAGRFITNPSLLHTSDSATIADDKAFAGGILKFTYDDRNNKLLPTIGAYLDVTIKGYTGLNTYSKSFIQVQPSIAIYKNLDRRSNIILADRLGGGFTFGKTTFYQSLFLGSQGNLVGYRQYRFAGQQMLYNDLEARIKLADIGSYIIPGQLGAIAFYDIGKVWAAGYNSDDWHQGMGGGIYFAPAQMLVISALAGHCDEGWYPMIKMGFRF